MKLEIQENSHANITFNTLAKVAVRGDHSYNVRWFLDNEFIGDMNLGGGNWGGFENKIGNWRVEFWQDENLVATHNNNLRDKNVLIVTSFGMSPKGKVPNMSNLNEFIVNIEEVYGCKVYVYFAGSEKFDVPFTTLKMNDDVDFELMIEKQF